MVNYNPKDWFGLIFRFHKSDTFRKLFWVILCLAIYSFVLAYFEMEVLKLQFKSTTSLHAILGFVLSILLVFRTNTAYDRWWEGRRLWGSLVNDSRSLVLKLHNMQAIREQANYKELIQWITLYPRALALHLRNLKLQDSQVPMEKHQPLFVEGKILSYLDTWKAKGVLTDTQLL